MSLTKILGIGLGIVGSLGAIGGITAAVVTKQNATTSLNTVNSSEDKTTLANKQEDKKEETKEKIVAKEEAEANKQTKATLLVTETAPSEIFKDLNEINEKRFPECSKSKQVQKETHSAQQQNKVDGYSFCSVA